MQNWQRSEEDAGDNEWYITSVRDVLNRIIQDKTVGGMVINPFSPGRVLPIPGFIFDPSDTEFEKALAR